MATQVEVISKVRRRVADYKTERLYSDEYYLDAVEFALSKLSHDFSTSYPEAESVPDGRVFLLIKLATIEMCYVRAASYADVEDSAGGTLAIDMVKVPDLEIESDGASIEDPAASWVNLAQKLQDEYDGELSHVGGSSNAAEIQTGVVKRISLTNGGYRKYTLDRGLDAVTLSSVVAGSDVALSWTAVYDETFNSYYVYRGTSITMTGEERLSVISDNHTVEYGDEGLASGTYYYRVKTVNANGIKINSNTITVVIT